jgi:hypothetical protein
MGQAGLPVSHQAINRWRRNQWRPLEREQHPLEVAREQLDDGAPLLTRDPTTVAEDLVKESVDDPYRPELHYMRGPGPKWREKHKHGAKP